MSVAERSAGPESVPRASRRDRERVFGGPARGVLLQTIAVAAVAVGAACVLYRVWRAAFDRPFAADGGDMLQVESLVKTVAEHGWFLHNPNLNAPFGQDYSDFPQNGESLQFVLLRILSLFLHRSGTIVNVYYLAGFGLLAAVTFLVLRHLGLSAWISAGAAVVFTFLPYHVYHQEQHLFRSTYLDVPLTGLLVFWSSGWRSRFLRDPADVGSWRHGGLRVGRVVAALAVCVVVGSWETVITAFAVLLLVAMALVDAARERDARRLVVGAVGTAAVLGTFVLVSLPSILYSHAHGPNRLAGHRPVAASETYGLKINRLVLPLDGHRLPFLQHLADRALAGSPVPSEGGQGLGLLLTAGLLGLLFALATSRTMRIDPATPQSWTSANALVRTSAAAVMVGLIVATVGGLSTVSALAGLQDVRTWSRMAIVIAFFCLVQVALWASAARTRLLRRGRATPVLVAVGVVIVTALAVADGPPVRHVDFTAVDRRWDADHAFVQRVAASQPSGAAVMQIPAWGFPEVPAPAGLEYDQPFRAYLADTSGLRWSWGGIHGRPDTAWQQPFARASTTADVLPALLGMGFTGLWVYPEGLQKDPSGLARLQQLLGTPLRSADGSAEFYDLRPYRQRLGLSDAQLRQRAERDLHVVPPG